MLALRRPLCLLSRRTFASGAATEASPSPSSSNKVQLVLACPDRLVLRKEADLVTVPGSSGVFGVGPNHVPIIDQLQPGILTITDEAEVLVKLLLVTPAL